MSPLTIWGELIRGAGVRARGPFAFPGRGVRAVGLGEYPVHFEVRVTQAQGLVHLVPLAWFTGIRTIDLAVNRHPLVQPVRVQHHLIHLLGWSVDVDGGAHPAHCATLLAGLPVGTVIAIAPPCRAALVPRPARSGAGAPRTPRRRRHRAGAGRVRVIPSTVRSTPGPHPPPPRPPRTRPE